MLLETGQVIDGKYRITRLIGTGGMGAVYEGENVLIRRRVAIKVLHADSTTSTDVIRRFEREAQAAGEIGNDHILEVLDLGSLPGGDRYMVMEYLDGETLAARIERHAHLTPQQVAPIARQFLTALISAHAAGIIHRDLKPENIFILRSKAGRSDFVKLIDFGISKFSRPFSEGEHRMTRANAVLGTPCYMSPEQARGAAETDVRSDIYSCGVILYEAVSGRLPFEGDSFNDLMFKIALSDPQPLEAIVPTIDPDFAAIIARAIAKDPADRFPSAQDFAATLEEWMQRNGIADGTSSSAASRGESLPLVEVASTTSATLAAPLAHPAASSSSFKKTGNDGSWARSGGLATGKRRRGAFVAGGSAAGIAALCIGIALMVRADPVPAVHGTKAPPDPPPAAATTEAPPAAPPVASLTPIPSTITAPEASASPEAAPRRPAAGWRPGPGAHAAPAAQPAPPPPPQPPPSVRPVADQPKPKAPARSSGFDLGY